MGATRAVPLIRRRGRHSAVGRGGRGLAARKGPLAGQHTHEQIWRTRWPFPEMREIVPDEVPQDTRVQALRIRLYFVEVALERPSQGGDDSLSAPETVAVTRGADG